MAENQGVRARNGRALSITTTINTPVSSALATPTSYAESSLGFPTPTCSTPSQSEFGADENNELEIFRASDPIPIRNRRGLMPSPIDYDQNNDSYPSTVEVLVEDYDCLILASDQGCLMTFFGSKAVLSSSSQQFGKFINQGIDMQTIEALDIETTHPIAIRKLKWTLITIGYNLLALKVILQILHHNPQRQFEELPWEEVIQMAFLCDEFLLQKALQPWSHIWVKRYQEYALKPGYEDWLYISSVFDKGTSTRFELAAVRRLVSRVILGTTNLSDQLVELLSDQCGALCFDSPKQYVLRNGKELPIGLWPVDRRDYIFNRRKQKINYYIVQLKSLKRILQHASKMDKFEEEEVDREKQSIRIAYGYLLLLIEEVNLNTLLTGGGLNYDGSVVDLLGKMKYITKRFNAQAGLHGLHKLFFPRSKFAEVWNRRFNRLLDIQPIDFNKNLTDWEEASSAERNKQAMPSESEMVNRKLLDTTDIEPDIVVQSLVILFLAMFIIIVVLAYKLLQKPVRRFPEFCLIGW